MTCKKCGAELSGKYDFCPKCGNHLKKKRKMGIMIGSAILVVLLGTGLALYMSGYYRNIAARFGWMPDEAVMAVADVGAEDAESDRMETDNRQERMEEDTENDTEEVGESVTETEEDIDETELFLENLTLESVEMTMGEICLVELEQAVPDGIWTSSDEKVVKAVEGQLTAVMPGSATVTFSAGGKEIPFSVTVSTFPDITLAVDCSRTIETNEIASNVRWETSEPEIVSVEDGVISSLSAGASTVTAYMDEVPYSFEVVATTPEITTTSVRKIIGNTQQVSILGTNGKAEWKSDNTAIATVSDTGLITAEPTGAGQSTVVHAYIDGMEFKIDVAVEPIPQLSSTYKMYGHENGSTYKNARITICTNANETVSFEYKETSNYNGDTEIFRYGTVKNVLNVADADYSSNEIYPLYHSFYSDYDDENYTDIYLVGTSQTAEVLVQQLDYSYIITNNDDGLSKAKSVVTYEPCENYGIIHIFCHDSTQSSTHAYERPYGLLVTVSVDGYEYQFVVDTAETYGNYYYSAIGGTFAYYRIEKFPADYMIEECSVDEIVDSEKINVNYSTLQENSKTFNSGTDWLERIGTKFVEEVEDQAIEMAAGFLLKAIFL